MRLILASASPRRRDLLRSIGADPLVHPVDVDETLSAAEPPEQAVVRLARAKAEAARRQRATFDDGASVVLAADTLVVLDGDVLGKPEDAAGARDMLSRLAGRRHEVLTGVHVLRTDGDVAAGGVGRTLVRFRPLDGATIDAYVKTGEPLDKAGAYGVQELGALLVEGIEGSWTNVVGLPLERLPGWLAAIEVATEDLLPWLRGDDDQSPISF